MITVEFTAKRNLTGSHASGDVVSLSFSAQEPLTPGRKISRNVQTAVNGARETLYHNALFTFEVTTQPVSGATLETLLEFLMSVESGESFQFYPWEVPTGNPSPLPSRWVGEGITCVLDSEQWTMTHVSSEATGGYQDWYTISFSVVQIP